MQCTRHHYTCSKPILSSKPFWCEDGGEAAASAGGRLRPSSRRQRDLTRGGYGTAFHAACTSATGNGGEFTMCLDGGIPTDFDFGPGVVDLGGSLQPAVLST